MDVMMSEMDRLTAARIIRGMKGPDAGKIAVMNEHLSKPSDETNMMRKIRGYITR